MVIVGRKDGNLGNSAVLPKVPENKLTAVTSTRLTSHGQKTFFVVQASDLMCGQLEKLIQNSATPCISFSSSAKKQFLHTEEVHRELKNLAFNVVIYFDSVQIFKYVLSEIPLFYKTFLLRLVGTFSFTSCCALRYRITALRICFSVCVHF